MKIRLAILAVALTTVMFSACKKDDNPGVSNLDIAGIWNVTSDIETNAENGIVVSSDTTEYPAGSFKIDFRSDKNVYVNNNGILDTSSYTVSGSNVVIDGQATFFATRAGNTMKLSETDTETENGITYTNVYTINLSK